MRSDKIHILRSGLHVFRDDLYPFLGGGNKGRKMDSIAEDVFRKKANALVTTGGMQSNHCRAVAVFAAQHQLDCTLVLHGSEDAFYVASGNAKIMRSSGAKIVFVDEPQSIGREMDKAMLSYARAGLAPYYIWGGGHTLAGGKAYVDAVGDLDKYCNEQNWSPKYIFHASGTGSTQSGILAGLDKYDLGTQVIGISVGRRSEPAQQVVGDMYREICAHDHITCTNRPVVVLDDYLCGGYGLYNEEIERLCANSIKNYGFTLDRCYTGKAFYGMLDYMEKHNILPEDSLFWHTGGIFNFLAE